MSVSQTEVSSRASRWTNQALNFWFKPMDVLPLRMFEWILCFRCSIICRTPKDTALVDWQLGFSCLAKATSSAYLTPPPLVPDEWFVRRGCCVYAAG